MRRNYNPILERLNLLTYREQCNVLWMFDIIGECGWGDFPGRAFWETKMKEKREREIVREQMANSR